MKKEKLNLIDLPRQQEFGGNEFLFSILLIDDRPTYNGLSIPSNSVMQYNAQNRPRKKF